MVISIHIVSYDFVQILMKFESFMKIFVVGITLIIF